MKTRIYAAPAVKGLMLGQPMLGQRLLFAGYKYKTQLMSYINAKH